MIRREEHDRNAQAAKGVLAGIQFVMRLLGIERDGLLYKFIEQEAQTWLKDPQAYEFDEFDAWRDITVTRTIKRPGEPAEVKCEYISPEMLAVLKKNTSFEAIKKGNKRRKAAMLELMRRTDKVIQVAKAQKPVKRLPKLGKAKRSDGPKKTQKKAARR